MVQAQILIHWKHVRLEAATWKQLGSFHWLFPDFITVADVVVSCPAILVDKDSF